MSPEQVSKLLDRVGTCLQSHKGVSLFHESDHKFEGWLHVQLVEALIDLDIVRSGIRVEERVDDDPNRFPDISWGAAPEQTVIEVKLIAARSTSQDLHSIEIEFERIAHLQGVSEAWVLFGMIPERLSTQYYVDRLNDILGRCSQPIRSAHGGLYGCRVR